MKIAELRKKTDQELKDLLLVLKKELMALRFQRAQGVPGNTSRSKTVRKIVAKIKTLFNNERSASCEVKNA